MLRRTVAAAGWPVPGVTILILAAFVGGTPVEGQSGAPARDAAAVHRAEGLAHGYDLDYDLARQAFERAKDEPCADEARRLLKRDETDAQSPRRTSARESGH
jgi:hypothetical protein